jgi:tellurite methyltransferase
MAGNRSVEFFDSQFRAQTRNGELVLNPFEAAALPFLRGRVLDLGCGLGNLALEAARRGCTVVALDASPHAIGHIRDSARAESLSVRADVADLATWPIDGEFDTIVAIGLLMFFPKARALAMLADIREHVRPCGHAIVNVLVEGTTYLDMFEVDHYYLFAADELERAFAGWRMHVARHDRFDAPGARLKAFSTVIAERPG